MAINEETVKKVANLARLHLEEDEVKRMSSELSGILDYISALDEVDTSDVEPIANVAGLTNVTRPDEPRGMLSVEQVLANAPQANASGFLVPRAVER